MRREFILSIMRVMGLLVISTVTLAFELLHSGNAAGFIGEDQIVIGGIKYYHEWKNDVDKKNIYILEKKTEQKKLIYQTQKAYIDQISVSPNKEFIVAIETDESQENSLVMINPKGEIKMRLEQDVRKYDWSPDGNEIAYITGRYSEDGIGFVSDGLYVFDLNGGQIKQIAQKAYYVNWVAFDGCIYYYDLGEVFRFDPIRGIAERTPYHGLNFSPDGQYYTTSSMEQNYEVYSTKTNEPVTDRLSARFKDYKIRPNWIPDQDHCLLILRVDYDFAPRDTINTGLPKVKKILGIKQRKHVIYDIENDKIIKEWVEKP